MEKFEELQDKKETFRKVINLINQMEFNLNSNNQLLTISVPECQIEGILRQNFNFYR